MKTAWQLAGVAFVAFSIFVVTESLSYGFLDELGPGPGFFPVLVGIMIGVLSLSLVVQVAVTGGPVSEAASVLPRGQEASRVLLVLGGLVGVVVLIQPLGFRATMLAFLIYMLVSLRVRNLWIVAAISLAGSFGTYHVFYHWLKVPLSTGYWLGF